jgi:hypothetical protein
MPNNRSKRNKRSGKFPLTLYPIGQHCKGIRDNLYCSGANKQQALQRRPTFNGSAKDDTGKRPVMRRF